MIPARIAHAAGRAAGLASFTVHVGIVTTTFASAYLAGRTLARAIQYVGDARGRCPR